MSLSLDEEVLNLEDCSHNDKVKKVKKIHQVLCHPRKDILLNFFRGSSSNDRETLEIVKNVSKIAKYASPTKGLREIQK